MRPWTASTAPGARSPTALVTWTRALGGVSDGDPVAESTVRLDTPVHPVRPLAKLVWARTVGPPPPAMVTGADDALVGPVLGPSEAWTLQVCTDPGVSPVSVKDTVPVVPPETVPIGVLPASRNTEYVSMVARSSVAAGHTTVACPDTVLVAVGVPGADGGTRSGSDTPGRKTVMARPPCAATIPFREEIRTGDSRLVVVPSPSWPESLWPQAHTAPVEVSAKVWSRPSPTSTIAGSPGTTAGDVRVAVVPRPVWPRWLRPHVRTVPSVDTTTECSAPESTWRAPDVITRTGTSDRVVEPIPSWP